MKISHLIIAAAASLTAGGVSHAQTCEQPLSFPMDFLPEVVGNTAAAVNSVPAVANGTIATPGRDVVYRVHLSPEMLPFSFSLQPAVGTTAGMFLCRSCEAPADCVAFGDKGSLDQTEELHVEGLDGWFYLIVDAMNGQGGQYMLGYQGNFQD